ncbi:MAG TPA: hypothetical protein VK249_11115 [Anaerolineales bacterium]|nr:hypothetical protein [Anaerolineales bacterium]
MTKKQRQFRSKNSKPYWGVLAGEPVYKPLLTPNKFMKLLQGQHQNASVPGKDKQSGYGLPS